MKEKFECPRCGGRARLENSIMAGAYIICPACGLKTKAYLDPSQAIREWKKHEQEEERSKPYKTAVKNGMFQLTRWLDVDDPQNKKFFDKLSYFIERDKDREMIIAEHPDRRGFVAVFVDDLTNN